MKKSKMFTSCLLFFALCFSSCDNHKLKGPEEVGNEVFNILSNITTMTKEEYFKNFFTIQEIHKLAMDKQLFKDEQIREKMISMSEKELFNKIEEGYNGIKGEGAKYGIVWKEIQYLDFIYQVGDKYGYKRIDGRLFFKYNEKSYNVEVSLGYDGEGYKFIEIENLYDDE